jgi:hypothetical protein
MAAAEENMSWCWKRRFVAQNAPIEKPMRMRWSASA